MNEKSWDKHFLDIASRQGAVLVDDDHQILIMGSPEHIEGFLYLAGIYFPDLGNTIYLPHRPCTKCHQLILFKDIKDIVWYTPDHTIARERQYH